MMALIITTLSVYYCTLVLTAYDGPFDLFLLFRKEYKALECFTCTSFWVSLFFVVALNQDWSFVLAYAGASTIINKVV